MPVPFAIALFLNQEREVLAVVVLVVHYVIKNHAAEHLFYILLALSKITSKRQKVEIIENGVGKGNVEQGSSCGYAVRLFPDDETANLNAACTDLQKGDLVTAEKHLAKAGNSKEAERIIGIDTFRVSMLKY